MIEWVAPPQFTRDRERETIVFEVTVDQIVRLGRWATNKGLEESLCDVALDGWGMANVKFSARVIKRTRRLATADDLRDFEETR